MDAPLIVRNRVVMQVVDGAERCAFVSEDVHVAGPVPLVMERKRAACEGTATRAPVLLVHGFGQNGHAWHLPSRSLANHLAREGYDVFNLDLRGHGRSAEDGQRAKSVHDYVREDLPRALAEVRALSGGRKVFVVGHSLGGIVGAAAATVVPEFVQGLVAIGSPYDFGNGSLALTALRSGVHALAKSGLALSNTALPLHSLGAVFRRSRVVTERLLSPVTLRAWDPGSMEAHVLDEHLRLAFDRTGVGVMMDLVGWTADGRTKNPYGPELERLAHPLLVVAGRHDELAPLASVKPLFDRSASTDKAFVPVDGGHIDLLVGRHAPKAVWPVVTNWLDARSPRVAKPSTSALRKADAA
ncbi:MAG: alpha/beta hydrolase [Polyangiaceae bacterium]